MKRVSRVQELSQGEPKKAFLEASELYAIDKHVSIMLVPFELPAKLTAICLAGKDPFDDRPGVVRVI